MKNAVYLSGAITSDPRSWEWRNEATTWFEQRGAKVLDPLRGKDLSSIKGLGYQSNIPGWCFVQRDIIDIINNSGIVLVNLEYVPERQMIGTLMELGICVATHTPFIAYTTQQQFINHPFITEFSVKVLSDIEEAMAACLFILS